MWPVFTVGAASLAAGMLIGKSRIPPWVAGVIGCAAAIPWLLFIAYYLHIADYTAYFEWRALPSTDLLAGLIALPVGLVAARYLRAIAWRVVASASVLAGLLIVAAFAKPLLSPIPASSISERSTQGVCLQSTPATCGPCAAATVLGHLGHRAGEAELADEAATTRTGTLNWLLARALRHRGFEARFSAPDSLDAVAAPAVVGVTLRHSGIGHFIAYLGTTGGKYIVGEPMKGRLELSRNEFERAYVFERFALEVAAR